MAILGEVVRAPIATASGRSLIWPSWSIIPRKVTVFTQEGFGEVLSRRPSYSCSSETPQQQHSFAQLTFLFPPTHSWE